MPTKPKPRIWIIALGLLLFAVAPATAGSISVRWDPVPGAAGYNVYYGSDSGQYDQAIDVGNATSHTLQSMANCRDTFVAVKAYNYLGEESAGFSNEISGWPRPVLTTVGVMQVMQGEQITLDITGGNFQPGAEIVFDTSGIPVDASGDPLLSIDSAIVSSCTAISAMLTVESTARGFRAMEIGDFSIGFEVRNPDTVFGSGSRTLTVQFNPVRADVNRSDSSTRDRVDGKDLIWMAYSYARLEGDPFYNPDADLDGNGQIDGQDLSLLAVDFGRCWDGSGWSAAACP
jgi:hypothetical protein